jgi:WD40 repeat protein
MVQVAQKLLMYRTQKMPWTFDKLCRVACAVTAWVAAWVGLTCLRRAPVNIFVVCPKTPALVPKIRRASRSDLEARERLAGLTIGAKLPVKDVCDIVVQYNSKFGAKLVREFRWSLPTIVSIVVVGSTRVAVACADDTVRVWDVWAARCVLIFKQQGVEQMVAIQTDSLACAGPTEVVVWDLRTGRQRSKIPLKEVYRMVATVGGLAVISGSEHFLDVWDVDARDLVQYMGRHATGLCSTVDGHQIVACFLDGIVRVFDARTGRCVSKLAWFLEHVELAALSCGRVVLATDASLCIWDPTERFPTVFIEVPGSDVVRMVAMLDHDTLVSWSSSGAWHAWDVITGVCLNTFTLPAMQQADCTGDRAQRVKVVGGAIAFCSDAHVSLYQ